MSMFETHRARGTQKKKKKRNTPRLLYDRDPTQTMDSLWFAKKNFFESNKKQKNSKFQTRSLERNKKAKREKMYLLGFKCVDVTFISSLFVFMTQNKNKLFAVVHNFSFFAPRQYILRINHILDSIIVQRFVNDTFVCHRVSNHYSFLSL